jgi:hypothetical protein
MCNREVTPRLTQAQLGDCTSFGRGADGHKTDAHRLACDRATHLVSWDAEMTRSESAEDRARSLAQAVGSLRAVGLGVDDEEIASILHRWTRGDMSTERMRALVRERCERTSP